MKIQSVAGIIFSSDRKKVLLIKRRDVPVWVLPGGGVEAKENTKEAILREMAEETGLTVAIKRKVGTYIPVNRLTRYTDLFELIKKKGRLKISEETAAIAYFPIDDLPPMPPPYHAWIMDAYANYPYELKKKLSDVNYLQLIKHSLCHPILVFRFLLSRMGISINSP